jgi:hypothetical protein
MLEGVIMGRHNRPVWQNNRGEVEPAMRKVKEAGEQNIGSKAQGRMDQLQDDFDLGYSPEEIQAAVDKTTLVDAEEETRKSFDRVAEVEDNAEQALTHLGEMEREIEEDNEAAEEAPVFGNKFENPMTFGSIDTGKT